MSETATATYEKPLSVIDSGTKPFWDAARDQRLVIPKCRSCGKYHFYPRESCPIATGRSRWTE